MLARTLSGMDDNNLLRQLPLLAKGWTDGSWRGVDNPADHDPIWHQWGIFGHTKRTWAAMKTEVPLFCLAWGIPFIRELKEEQIQHQSKWNLLSTACLLHDIGKWVCRITKKDGSYSFKGHEMISENIIRYDPTLRQILFSNQMQADHLEYVASVVGLHYELGRLRQVAYQQERFDLTFLQSDTFQSNCVAIIKQHPLYVREIGLIFLADSLAKVEFRIGVESLVMIESRLLDAGLSRGLLGAILQVPVNIALCKAYFGTLTEDLPWDFRRDY